MKLVIAFFFGSLYLFGIFSIILKIKSWCKIKRERRIADIRLYDNVNFYTNIEYTGSFAGVYRKGKYKTFENYEQYKKDILALKFP